MTLGSSRGLLARNSRSRAPSARPPDRTPITSASRPTQQRAVGRSEALTLLPSARSSGLDQRACRSFEAGAGDGAELPSRRALRH
jgi:hypothetical protein